MVQRKALEGVLLWYNELAMEDVTIPYMKDVKDVVFPLQ